MSDIGISQDRLPPRIIFSRNAEIGQVNEPARLRKDHLWMDIRQVACFIVTSQ